MSKWIVSELLGQASIFSRKLSDEIDKHLAAMDANPVEPDGFRPPDATDEKSTDAAAQWRALRKGEEIREGDEAYYSLIGWKPSHLKIGTVVGDGTMRFRRRVTPVVETTPDVGEGWRELGLNETCQEGDQFSLTRKDWYPVELMESYRYRRRVVPEVAPIAKEAELSASSGNSLSITETWAAEVSRLTAENERLKLSAEERLAMDVTERRPPAAAADETSQPTPEAGGHVCKIDKTCSCSVVGLEPSEKCPQHGGGEYPPRCVTCGRFVSMSADKPDVGDEWVEIFVSASGPVIYRRRVGTGMTAENHLLGTELESARALGDALRNDNVRLRDEVERLRDLAQRHKQKLEARLGGGE